MSEWGIACLSPTQTNQSICYYELFVVDQKNADKEMHIIVFNWVITNSSLISQLGDKHFYQCVSTIHTDISAYISLRDFTKSSQCFDAEIR